MNYTHDELLRYVEDCIGVDLVAKMSPRVDRLISLYLQFSRIDEWLDFNKGLVGSKDYKEYVVAMNGIMANIKGLEDGLELFKDKPVEASVNPLVGRLSKK